jgi:hypothetical protein
MGRVIALRDDRVDSHANDDAHLPITADHVSRRRVGTELKRQYAT